MMPVTSSSTEADGLRVVELVREQKRMSKFFSRGKKLLGLGPPCEIKVKFADEDVRKKIEVVRENSTEELFLFAGNEPVNGSVTITPLPGKKVEHTGIKVELIGQIVITYDRTEKHEFTSVVRELEGGSEITSEQTFPFEFPTVEKNFESYNGINARLRYFLRVTISRQYSTNIHHEHEFWVINSQVEPQVNNGIRMEVGIEDCLHIEFEYDKSKYSLHDVILGKIYFLLVRIKIKHMELAIIRRESTGTPPNVYNESETVTKFEIMDGAPEKGESIPVRLFLKGINHTPTYRNVNNKFSVRYYLNLVLVDEEERRYFKQQEITLWRKGDEV